jgi:hypothetical protein
MENNGRFGAIGRMTGIAATSAPVVRRLTADEDLRTDASELIGSAGHLARRLATDRQLRRDVRRMIAAARSGSRHIRRDASRRNNSRALFWMGAGMVFGVLTVAAALLYPRTRQSVVHAADETIQRTSATVHDLRQAYDRRRSRSVEAPAAERAA